MFVPLLFTLIAFVVASPTTNEIMGNLFSSRTTAAPGWKRLDTHDYFPIPLISTGNVIPLLAGTYGAYYPDASQNYTVFGSLDGTGVEKVGAHWYVYVNHEYATQHETSLPNPGAPKFFGAMMSLFVFTEDFRIVGGKYLVTEQYSATTSERLNVPFGGLCSATLVQTGFVDGPVFLSAEEGDGGVNVWAVYVKTGKALRIEGLGASHHENAVPASSYLPSRNHPSKKTVILSTDDSPDGSGEVYMYVGDQTAADPNGFATGTLYALKVTGYAYETMPPNTPLPITWTPIPRDVALNPSYQALDDWGNAQDRTTNFRKVEDLTEDPMNPETFYFAATGGNFARDGSILSVSECGNTSVVGGCDNPFGKIYKLVINKDDPTAAGTIELIIEGSATNGGGFDNVLASRDGNLYIVEDPTPTALELIYKPQQRYARILRYNFASKIVTPFMELDYASLTRAAPYTAHMSHSGLIEFGSDSKPVFMMALQGPAFSVPPSNASLLNIFSGQLALFVPLDTESTSGLSSKDFGPIPSYAASSASGTGGSSPSNNGAVIAAVIGWLLAAVLFIALIGLYFFLKPSPVEKF